MKELSQIIEKARLLPERKISLAGADDVDSLLAVEEARVEDIADAVLVGDEKKIAKVLYERIRSKF